MSKKLIIAVDINVLYASMSLSTCASPDSKGCSPPLYPLFLVKATK